MSACNNFLSLELFQVLIFVLAITSETNLMQDIQIYEHLQDGLTVAIHRVRRGRVQKRTVCVLET